MATVLYKIWSAYRNYIEKYNSGNSGNLIKSIGYWREQLFTTFSIYFLPISFIALIPGVYMSIHMKAYYVAVFDILAAIVITLIIFSNKLSPNVKKSFVAGILYMLALFLITSLGLFGPGIIYLLAITIFLTLILPVKWAYWSVGLHCLTCIIFGLIIQFKLVDSFLIGKYTIGVWVAFSSNLIFLSLVSVILINKLITGLRKTIIQEHKLQRSLEKETREKIVLIQQLLESKLLYKSLFDLNPSPMWVLDSKSLRFLQVNEVAIKDYGYTREEFLAMTVQDIKCDKNMEILANQVNDIIAKNEPYHFTSMHCGKDQQPFPVDMRCSAIPFKGKDAILGSSRDITDLVNYTTEIENQNSKLREIAFLQSHVVRAPLARMMGLMDIFNSTDNDESKAEVIGYLKLTAKEIDVVINDIIKKAQVVDEVYVRLNKQKR